MTLVASLTDETFERNVLNANLPVLVDFYADWRGPCKAMAPCVDDLAREYAGEVAFYKIDTGANPTTLSQYGVRGIPAFLLFKDGKVHTTVGGVMSRAALGAVIQAALVK